MGRFRRSRLKTSLSTSDSAATVGFLRGPTESKFPTKHTPPSSSSSSSSPLTAGARVHRFRNLVVPVVAATVTASFTPNALCTAICLADDGNNPRGDCGEAIDSIDDIAMVYRRRRGQLYVAEKRQRAEAARKENIEIACFQALLDEQRKAAERNKLQEMYQNIVLQEYMLGQQQQLEAQRKENARRRKKLLEERSKKQQKEDERIKKEERRRREKEINFSHAPIPETCLVTENGIQYLRHQVFTDELLQQRFRYWCKEDPEWVIPESIENAKTTLSQAWSECIVFSSDPGRCHVGRRVFRLPAGCDTRSLLGVVFPFRYFTDSVPVYLVFLPDAASENDVAVYSTLDLSKAQYVASSYRMLVQPPRTGVPFVSLQHHSSGKRLYAVNYICDQQRVSRCFLKCQDAEDFAHQLWTGEMWPASAAGHCLQKDVVQEWYRDHVNAVLQLGAKCCQKKGGVRKSTFLKTLHAWGISDSTLPDLARLWDDAIRRGHLAENKDGWMTFYKEDTTNTTNANCSPNLDMTSGFETKEYEDAMMHDLKVNHLTDVDAKATHFANSQRPGTVLPKERPAVEPQLFTHAPTHRNQTTTNTSRADEYEDDYFEDDDDDEEELGMIR